MKRLIELRPNRDLLDNDFNGYKLSLDSIPMYEKNLETGVDVVLPGDDQYSYAHVRIFSLHNYLHFSPTMPDLAYYVDDKWNVVQVSIGRMNRCESLTPVCEIPRSRDRQEGDFPVTLHFASADRVVIADGTGGFHVAAVKKDKWVIVFSDTVPSGSNSILLSAIQSRSQLCLLFRTIIEPTFDSLLHFLVLDENWQIVRRRNVQVCGNIVFASVESPTSLTLVKDGPKYPKFLSEGAAVDSMESSPKYRWTQTSEDVTITVQVKNCQVDEISVETEGQNLSVTLKGDVFIQGVFAGDVSNVTWETNDGLLDIRAVKSDPGEGWRQALEGDEDGEQYQAECRDDRAPAYSAEDLEDVDVASPASLLRLDVDQMIVSHEVDLSTQAFLFSVAVDADKPAAICTRHLTDACVWQFNMSDSGNWTESHLGTFHAFGYVQASKTQRKFITAPDNLSYVVISDAFRHLYLFRQPSPVDGSLRNRTSGVRVNAVARQHLINLEDRDEILGIRATNSLIYILTKRKFYVLVINQTML